MAWMREHALILQRRSNSLICLLAYGVLAACTSLESRLSVEPYTKNKPMRNSLEQVAEDFCGKKRAAVNGDTPVRLPDFIFTTDGCTRWTDNSWLACCIAHDIAYWCGGSEEDRKEADRELRRCVKAKSAMIGSIFYAGVRLGGAPWLPTPWRWGYGWDDWPRAYEKTNATPTVRKLMKELNIEGVIEQQLLGIEK